MYSMQGPWTISTRPYTAQRSDTRPRKRNPAESIAELREIANGHDDILAEAAGIRAGSWYASPVARVGHGLIAVGMLILAGGGAGRPP
jgi:hypothetical protein